MNQDMSLTLLGAGACSMGYAVTSLMNFNFSNYEQFVIAFSLLALSLIFAFWPNRQKKGQE
jgi:hypothetical protein